MPARPPSVHSLASSTDSEDCEENYVAMVPNMSTDDPVCKHMKFFFLQITNTCLNGTEVDTDQGENKN